MYRSNITARYCRYRLSLFCLLTAALLWQPRPLAAQRYNGHSIATAPDYCNYILTDRYGRLWVCTFHGLSRYDGHSFTNYKASDGLPDENLNAIAMDTTGRVYVLTGSGIARYTGGYRQKFRSYRSPLINPRCYLLCAVDSNHIYYGNYIDPGLRYLHNDTVVILPGITGSVQDVANDKRGQVYVTDEIGGIYHVANGRCNPLPYTLPDRRMENNLVMAAGADGEVYVYDGHTLSHVTTHGMVRIMDCPFVANTQRLLPARPDGSCLLGAWEYVIKVTPGRADTIDYLPGGNLQSIKGLAATPGGEVYMAGDRGVYIATQEVFLQSGSPGLAAVPVSYYYKADKRIWNSSGGQPVAGIAALPAGFGLRIFYAYKDQQDTVWLCTSGGIYTLNGGLRFRYTGPVTPGHASAYDSVFTCMVEQPDGTRWFSSISGLISYRGGQFRRYMAEGSDNTMVIYAMVSDGPRDLILAGPNGPSLFRDGRPSPLPPVLHIPPVSCTNVLRSGNGGMWLGLINGALYRMAARGGSYILTDSLHMSWESETPPPLNITEDDKGRLWVDYGRELIAFLPDAAGHYNVANRVTFSKADGLRGWRGSNPMRLSVLADGRVQLRERDTAFLFSDSLLEARLRHPQPPILMTGLLLQRREADWRGMGFRTDAENVPVDPAFSYRQNYLTFQFAAIEHLHPEYVTYRYRLSGIDTGWQPATRERSADYNNLPPGRYRFEVQAADIDGRWGEVRAYPFAIRPPWYATVWAYIIYGLLAFAGIYAVFRARGQVLRRRAAIAQQITESEKAVLEQQLKALRAQINPHFLQNSFDFIGQSLMQQEPGHTLGVIQQVSAYLRNVLYRSDETIVSLEQELDYAGEYLAVNRMLLRDRFTYRIDADEEVDTFDIQVPSMLLQPLLENAIKHGTGKAGGDILLSVTQDEQFVICLVRNSKPVGSHPVVQAEGYIAKGLSVTEERLALLYQGAGVQPKVWYEDDGAGYNVYIRLPRFN